jgi:outer membrane protein assembly factor BamD (BamD/ComL family)
VLDANLADRTTEEATYLLAVAYERDGQNDQAAEAVRSLLTAFPQSRYAKPAEKLRARLAGGTG